MFNFFENYSFYTESLSFLCDLNNNININVTTLQKYINNYFNSNNKEIMKLIHQINNTIVENKKLFDNHLSSLNYSLENDKGWLAKKIIESKKTNTIIHHKDIIASYNNIINYFNSENNKLHNEKPLT